MHISLVPHVEWVLILRTRKFSVEEREANLGTPKSREHKAWNTKKMVQIGTREHEGKIKECGHGGHNTFPERAPISGYSKNVQK